MRIQPALLAICLSAWVIAAGASLTTASGAQLIFAANARTITAYRLSDTGNVLPVLTIGGPRTHLGWGGPTNVAVGPEGAVYSLNGSYVNVYAAGAYGNVAPAKTIACGGMYVSFGLAVDSRGSVYVASAPDAPAYGISIFDREDAGCVRHNRVIADLEPVPQHHDRTGLGDPFAVAVDDDQTIYALNTGIDYGKLSITEYGRYASGDAQPLRVIMGPRTELAQYPAALALDSHENLYVTQNVYNSWYCSVRATILEFAGSALGNIAPIREISGPRTLLRQAYGIAVDRSGRIYVSDGNAINVYAADAQGDAAPIRRIKGPNTGLDRTFGIALSARD